jgi:hypothetical protein
MVDGFVITLWFNEGFVCIRDMRLRFCGLGERYICPVPFKFVESAIRVCQNQETFEIEEVL